MKSPQDLADVIGRFGCCAFTTLWALGIEPKTDYEAVAMIGRAIESGSCDDECTVQWFKFVKQFTGRETKVEFLSINKLSDLNNKKSICNRYPVRFDYNGKSHWVGVENGKVVFNSLKHSVCVEKGKPVTARIITLS